MDQTILNWLIFTLTGVLGWLLKNLWSELQTLKAQVMQINILVVGEYVKRSELAEIIDKISDQLNKILDKLDMKADKP